MRISRGVAGQSREQQRTHFTAYHINCYSLSSHYSIIHANYQALILALRHAWALKIVRAWVYDSVFASERVFL